MDDGRVKGSDTSMSDFRHYQKKRMGLGKRLLTMSNAIHTGKRKPILPFQGNELTDRIRDEYLRIMKGKANGG